MKGVMGMSFILGGCFHSKLTTRPEPKSRCDSHRKRHLETRAASFEDCSRDAPAGARKLRPRTNLVATNN
jgi:hypothetical protein